MFVPFSSVEPQAQVYSGPPDATKPHVRAFCERISPGVSPLLVTIQPEQGCRPRECFWNVKQKVEREGGRVLFGWAIWEWPRVFIEGEHHAIYQAPDGSFHDPTPSIPEDPQVARLFLRDDNVAYDYDARDPIRRYNIREALSPDEQIVEYLRLAEELAGIISRTPGTGMVPIIDTDVIRAQAIAKRSTWLKRQIAMRYTAQSAPCYCGSGRKFKKCHGVPKKHKIN